jgi:dipeptidyl aminopeptidase/acylaminoacyl peptidase
MSKSLGAVLVLAAMSITGCQLSAGTSLPTEEFVTTASPLASPAASERPPAPESASAGRLVFVSRRTDFNGDGELDDADGTDLYTMEVFSGEEVALTADVYIDQHPRWSPDGTQVAFSSNRDGDFDVYVIDADGGNLRQVTQNGSDDLHPDWSPDGGYLVFISNETGYSEVYTVSLSTEVVVQQTFSNADLAFWYDERIFWQTDWSPTDRDLVLLTISEPLPPVAGVSYRVSRIWLLDLVSGQMNLLTPEDWHYMGARWSPNGNTIVFEGMTVEGDSPVMSMEGEILLLDGVYTLEPSEYPVAYGRDGQFTSWSPDGTAKVAVASPSIGLPSELFIYATASRTWTRVTDNAFLDEQADWR